MSLFTQVRDNITFRHGAAGAIDPLNVVHGGPDTQSLLQQLFNPQKKSGSGGGINMSDMPQLENTPGYKASEGEALRKGPSTWMNLANNLEDQKRTQMLDQGAGQNAGATATAEADLAAHGGLSSGARERVAEGGAKNYLSMVQDTNNQSNNNKLQIGINDEQNRLKSLQDYNTLNTTNYGNQLQAWASGKTANAMQNSGKKS